MKIKTFLKSQCPFRIIDERVTWGEYLKTILQGIFGMICFYAFYLEMIIIAESTGVIR